VTKEKRKISTGNTCFDRSCWGETSAEQVKAKLQNSLGKVANLIF